MGNNPSAAAKSSPSSPSPSPGHETSKLPSRRDHPRNLLQSQRTAAAAAEPSLAQARGTTVTHRSRNSQSIPAAHVNLNLNHSQSSHSSSPSYDASPLVPAVSEKSKDEAKVDLRDQPSKPVDVPIPASNTESASLRSHSLSQSQSIDPSGPPVSQDMSYHLTKPPRLPLPIEEEVHTPGSPIIAPADVGIDATPLDIEHAEHEGLPRRTSALSNTTIDEEDAEELRVDKTKATVPTIFEWLQGGERVYVTGTIFHWNKKHRLQPVEGHPGLLKATIHVQPGTHHIRFIVDGVMQCSPDLPTTVDFGNNLVNYIEVSADDIPRDTPAQAERSGLPDAFNESTGAQTDRLTKDDNGKEIKPAPKTKPAMASTRYTSEIPQYLLDLDKAEDTTAYQNAATAIEKLPTPPSLPGFLGKPILNAATPVKDDNSVLTMPNHTVLNHLATSSIKNNVLAVSVTTRYKRKYVTSIVYQPTADEQ